MTWSCANPQRHVVAERVDAFRRRARLVFLDQFVDAGKFIFGTGSQSHD
jgi:hypothetical protein